MDKLPQVSLALHKAIGDVHFPAESWQPHHQLNGVDIVGNDHNLGLSLFDELGDVVETELDVVWSCFFDCLF